jgi:hypothetical protein
VVPLFRKGITGRWFAGTRAEAFNFNSPLEYRPRNIETDNLRESNLPLMVATKVVQPPRFVCAFDIHSIINTHPTNYFGLLSLVDRERSQFNCASEKLHAKSSEIAHAEQPIEAPTKRISIPSNHSNRTNWISGQRTYSRRVPKSEFTRKRPSSSQCAQADWKGVAASDDALLSI